VTASARRGNGFEHAGEEMVSNTPERNGLPESERARERERERGVSPFQHEEKLEKV
jgi:hypothetical protein